MDEIGAHRVAPLGTAEVGELPGLIEEVIFTLVVDQPVRVVREVGSRTEVKQS